MAGVFIRYHTIEVQSRSSAIRPSSTNRPDRRKYLLPYSVNRMTLLQPVWPAAACVCSFPASAPSDWLDSCTPQHLSNCLWSSPTESSCLHLIQDSARSMNSTEEALTTLDWTLDCSCAGRNVVYCSHLLGLLCKTAVVSTYLLIFIVSPWAIP